MILPAPDAKVVASGAEVEQARVTRRRRDERDAGMLADDRARERTARRLLVVRLRVEIAGLEAEHPADPQLGEARQELRGLNGAASDAD